MNLLTCTDFELRELVTSPPSIINQWFFNNEHYLSNLSRPEKVLILQRFLDFITVHRSTFDVIGDSLISFNAKLMEKII